MRKNTDYLKTPRKAALHMGGEYCAIFLSKFIPTTIIRLIIVLRNDVRILK